MNRFSTKNYGQGLTIFVGGICTSISEDMLLSYFSQFGQVDWITFQPRGHGFKRLANEVVSGKQPHRGCGLLKMNNEQEFDAVLQRKIHHFLNTTMECRPALSAGDRKRLNQQIAKEGRKVFVGGLPQNSNLVTTNIEIFTNKESMPCNKLAPAIRLLTSQLMLSRQAELWSASSLTTDHKILGSGRIGFRDH